MNEQFKYDVFISHSEKDKPVARELAERLRQDGLRVWPGVVEDELETKPGDAILLKIEEGLEQSRTLVLVMSANASARRGADRVASDAPDFRRLRLTPAREH